MSQRKLLACGHADNATNAEGKACCVHHGTTREWPPVLMPDLNRRLAKCHCGKTVTSSVNEAFFEYKSGSDFDGFYCGCQGWD